MRIGRAQNQVRRPGLSAGALRFAVRLRGSAEHVKAEAARRDASKQLRDADTCRQGRAAAAKHDEGLPGLRGSETCSAK